MASSDDFREQLKIGNIREALALALSDATELKITTWVASQSDAIEATEAKPGHRLRTRINLIEGAIENEVGDQFIANGRYRELRQFHLDQVAVSNLIIQNNLKSLQKLFEVLVAMRYQSATPSVIEPESLGFESQLLPPTFENTDAGFVIEPQKSVVEDSVLSTDTVTNEAIAQEPLPSQEPGLFPTTPTDSREALEEEADQDDWDDSVLDLLESLPVPPRPNQNALDPQFDQDPRNLIEEQPEPSPSASASLINQDWGILTGEDLESPTASPEPNIEALNSQLDEDPKNLIEEESEPGPAAANLLVSQDLETPTQEDLESPPTSTQPNIEASNVQFDDDWGDLIEEEPEPEPSASASLVNQDWGILTQEDLESPPTSAQSKIEASNSQLDDDWGWEDLAEEEPEPNQDHSIPSMDSLNLEEDEDWDDWVMEEPEPLQNEPVPVTDIDPLDLEEDEDWGDLVDDSNPFAVAPTASGLASNLEDDEDWDEFAAEELEPYSAFIDVEANTVSTGFESSSSLEDLTDLGRVLDQTENPDLSENLMTDSSTETGSGEEFDHFLQTPENTPSQNVDRDLMVDLFGEPEPQQRRSDPTRPDNTSGDAREETLFAQMQFDDFSASLEDSERGDLSKDSDPLAVSEHDLEAKPKSVEKRVPPPPPPSRFPNQNN